MKNFLISDLHFDVFEWFREIFIVFLVFENFTTRFTFTIDLMG